MGVPEKWNPRPGSVGGTRDPMPGILKVGPETWDLPHSWDSGPGIWDPKGGTRDPGS